MADTRISPYSLQDLKNTTDDAMGNYLRGLRFTQIHTKADVRLLLGYTAVIISAATFVADYKLGWEATKTWTAVAVAAYAMLNAALTYWMWFVEKGIVFEGEKGGKKVSIMSKTNKNEPTYYLTVSSSGTTGASQAWEISTPFTTWFTADGYFVAKPFQQWLASSVPVIGDVDEKNAMKDQRDELAAPGPGAMMAEKGAREGGAITSGSASAANGTGSKRSKRKS